MRRDIKIFFYSDVGFFKVSFEIFEFYYFKYYYRELWWNVLFDFIFEYIINMLIICYNVIVRDLFLENSIWEFYV